MSSIVDVPPIPHILVKANCSHKHIMCTGLYGLALKASGNRQELRLGSETLASLNAFIYLFFS